MLQKLVKENMVMQNYCKSKYFKVFISIFSDKTFFFTKNRNHQIFYGPLSLFLHLYSWTLEQGLKNKIIFHKIEIYLFFFEKCKDAIDFNNQFKKAADEYA